MKKYNSIFFLIFASNLTWASAVTTRTITRDVLLDVDGWQYHVTRVEPGGSAPWGYWQKKATGETEDPRETDRREGNRGDCPYPGMVEIKGKMKWEGEPLPSFVLDRKKFIEGVQEMHCKFDKHSKVFQEHDRCTEFDEEALKEKMKEYPTKDMSYCIDRFEFPNIKGENPVVMIAWPESDAACKALGKRLCTEDEWTFACEGEEALPYPYGYERSNEKCVIDKEWIAYSKTLSPRDKAPAGIELNRLWKAVESGSMPNCKSPFGVYDLTGNVDEWTRTSRTAGLKTILKGGYWGPVRTRCRPSTRNHNETHAFYQQGFRCCADLKAKEKKTD